MRAVLLALAIGGVLSAQPPMSPEAPLVTGVIVERDTAPTGGGFSIRVADGQVFRYAFDSKTYVEREDRLIDVPRLRAGDRVEVLSERLAELPLRYARTIHVVMEVAPAPRRAPPRRRFGSADHSADEDDPLFFRGDLALAGVIVRLDSSRLVLRTRDGECAVLLRQDTRYLENGAIVDAAALAPNMRVFIRAGRNIYDQVEGFQVVWGKILEPR